MMGLDRTRIPYRFHIRRRGIVERLWNWWRNHMPDAELLERASDMQGDWEILWTAPLRELQDRDRISAQQLRWVIGAVRKHRERQAMFGLSGWLPDGCEFVEEDDE